MLATLVQSRRWLLTGRAQAVAQQRSQRHQSAHHSSLARLLQWTLKRRQLTSFKHFSTVADCSSVHLLRLPTCVVAQASSSLPTSFCHMFHR